jgi:membrane-anchored glycerophosphoryl diester phosphodiesterase (GDPDase)
MSSQSAPTNQPEKGGRIRRSWRLTRASWQVVRSDPAMLVLVLLAALVAVVAIVLGFTIDHAVFGKGHIHGTRFAVLAGILLYVLTFVSVFFNTAIAASASAAMDGRKLSLGEALAISASRVGQIAVFSLLAVLLGIVIEQLARRIPVVGGIVSRLLGLGWSLASLFAIPVLALEGGSAAHALRRSTEVVKKRWGEGIGGSVIIGVWTGLVLIPLCILFILAIAATHRHSAPRDAIIVAFLACLAALFGFSAVIRQTFAVALYRYANGDGAPSQFSKSDLEAPFRKRRGLLS